MWSKGARLNTLESVSIQFTEGRGGAAGGSPAREELSGPHQKQFGDQKSVSNGENLHKY